jgi:hypothetical protein
MIETLNQQGYILLSAPGEDNTTVTVKLGIIEVVGGEETQ